MMSDERVIFREFDGAVYTIDGTSAPEYVLVYFNGPLSEELYQSYVNDLTRLMIDVSGPGTFCSLIIDVTQATPGSLGLNQLAQIEARINRRMGDVVIVSKPEFDNSDKAFFLQFMQAMRRDLKQAETIPQAEEMLGI